MSFSAESPPAGWYTDPAGSGGERYWDGGNWSQVTRPAGGLAYGHVPAPTPPSPYGYGYGVQGAAATARQPALAGFWWRVLAAILDNLVLLIPLNVLQTSVAGKSIDALGLWGADVLINLSEGNSVIPPFPDDALPGIWVYVLLSMAVLIAYRTVMVALRGATLGQMITGLQVVPDGSPLGTRPSWGTSALRAVLAVVFQQILFLGIVDALTMLFTAKKQTIHDLLARTVVIKK